jgi:phycocyanin-associated, rod
LSLNVEIKAMSGMNTLVSPGISDYQSRTITIGVSGVRQQSVMKTSNYQVRVPYSQMSQALQNINRQGGKVAFVQLMGNPSVYAGAASAVAEAPPAAATAPDDDAEATQEPSNSKRKRR